MSSHLKINILWPQIDMIVLKTLPYCQKSAKS